MSSPPSTLLRQWGLPLALFAVLWVDLWRQLCYTWDTNEQYAYGWFVPFLAVALFLRRWPTRPGSGISGQMLEVGNQKSATRGQLSAFQHFSISAFVLLLLLLLLPLRVIHEINQDWPLATWPYTIIVVLLTLYALHLSVPSLQNGPWSVVHGPWSIVSPWVKHFAFPVCFILVAVQWPYRIEKGLTQNLMQIVATLTVEIIGWFGIPAIQRGNLIEISTGVLGVDEACSGIRSFQSTLMAGLFLGELYLLRWPIRLLLVGAGLAAAFLLNVCRTLLLTWQANAHGISAVDKWHDPAGFTIAIACFGVLWLLAVLIKRRWPQEGQGSQSSMVSSPVPPDPRPQTPDPVLGPMDSGLRTQDSGLSPQPPAPNFQLSTLRRYLLAVGLWSLLCLIATEVWYRSHEIKETGVFRWTAEFPTNNPTYNAIDLSPKVVKELRHDLGGAGKWQDGRGVDWTVYFFRWNPSSVSQIIRARIHRPEVCLPASGLRLVEDLGTKYLEAHGLQLPFREYIYDSGGRPLYVFFCQWEDGAEKQSGIWGDGTRHAERFRTVLVGRRKLGQQSLQLLLTGPENLQEAELAVRQALPQLINLEAPVASRQ